MFLKILLIAFPCYFGAPISLIYPPLLLASKFAMNASMVSSLPPAILSIWDLMFGLRSVYDPLGSMVDLDFLNRALLIRSGTKSSRSN
jgi:hypothetical protein